MRRKYALLVIISLLLLYHAEAQTPLSFYPFKGFHVGVTGQAEFIQKNSYVALSGTDPAPKGRWTYGWEAGIEFSYHFARYFGIVVGINYGTAMSNKRDIYLSKVPNYEEGREEVNAYEPLLRSYHSDEFLFPVKLEFHYPLRKDLFQ